MKLVITMMIDISNEAGLGEVQSLKEDLMRIAVAHDSLVREIEDVHATLELPDSGKRSLRPLAKCAGDDKPAQLAEVLDLSLTLIVAARVSDIDEKKARTFLAHLPTQHVAAMVDEARRHLVSESSANMRRGR